MYVVFSFSGNWPIFAYHDGKWYANEDSYLGLRKLRRFRMQHRESARPVPMLESVAMSTAEIDAFVEQGLAAHPDMKRLLDVSVEN
jgi:hypothetical protein